MKWLGKYAVSFQLGLQCAMEYRTNFLLSIASTLFPIVIQIFLWTAIFDNSSYTKVFGYSYAQLIAYAVLAGIISKLVETGVEKEIAGDIKNGGLNKFIVRPIGYLFYRVCSFLGLKAVQLGIISVIFAVILIVMNVRLGLSSEPYRIAAFVLVIHLSLAFNLLLAFNISIIAFWTTEAWAVFMMLNLLMNIASGGIFPLDIFGDKAMEVFSLLPFKYIIYFPINIINGNLAAVEILPGIGMQALWIGILAVLSKCSWNAGMKRYVAVGG